MSKDYMKYGNIFEILSENAELYPERDALVFLGDDGSESVISFSELVSRSARYGKILKSEGLEKGDIAMILLPHSLEIIFAFFGGISEGIVTSIYPYPALNTDTGKSCDLVKQALRDIRARAVLTTPALAPGFSDSGCGVFVVEEGFPAGFSPKSSGLDPVSLDPEVAYLQLTSGTTGKSKGVLLSHRNMLAFTASLLNSKRWSYHCRVSWIPMYHTGALMGALISSLMSGMTLVLFPPSRWAFRPLTFFQAIERFRGDKITLPNSGFVHALKYVKEEDLEKLDLSCVRSLLSAGEPTGAEVVNRFYDKFEKAGLDRSSFSNAYGQAEITALISQSYSDGTIPVDRIDADLFYQSGTARKAEDAFSGPVLSVVSCGKPIPGVEVRIEDGEGTQLPERRVGEVVARGDVVFRGYHLAPELTAETLRGGWLHTGDVGYLADGEVYICDRKKDLIITGGKNVRPGDIEDLVYSEFNECSLCAAFGIFEEEIGTEKVALACEWARSLDMREQVGIEKRIRKLVYSGLSIAINEFRIVEKGWIEMTGTGKISRKATAEKLQREFG